LKGQAKLAHYGLIHNDRRLIWIAILWSILHLPDIEVGKCTEFNLRIEDDKKLCWITDMGMCEDGCIVMSDYNNKRIKKINESFHVVSSLKVRDNPFGICQVGTSLLAVTLINNRKVHFISQKETMELQQSFKVGDICRGIAYNDGMICLLWRISGS
jgi:hypothetical protein